MLTKAALQRLRSLRDKKHREEAGVFVVEGEKVVGELLQAGVIFAEVYATAKWLEKAPHHSGQATQITAADMARASHFPTPSTVLAVGKVARRVLEKKDLQTGLTLALDGVRDPGNVGNILRIADWYAVDRVILGADCADLFHQKVINASMGSFARVKTFSANLSEILADCGVPVFGSALSGDDVHRVPFPANGVIVIGSEGEGLSPAVEKFATRRITIPKFGGAESLNAAVAAAVICDNWRRGISGK